MIWNAFSSFLAFKAMMSIVMIFLVREIEPPHLPSCLFTLSAASWAQLGGFLHLQVTATNQFSRLDVWRTDGSRRKGMQSPRGASSHYGGLISYHPAPNWKHTVLQQKSDILFAEITLSQSPLSSSYLSSLLVNAEGNFSPSWGHQMPPAFHRPTLGLLSEKNSSSCWVPAHDKS